MSLLTRKAPHTVQVQNRKIERNAQGIRVPVNVGELVTVRGMAEPVRDWSSAEESQSGGLQITNLVVWRSKEWPGDVHSHVLYEGDWYESVGEPQRHHVSNRTGHWRVTLRWLQEAD